LTRGEVELGPAHLQATTNYRHLLCLSGGGYRGLYTALVLEALEEKAKKPLADIFDVVAGTSIGAVIAAGLALRVPAETLRQAVENHGPRVFDRRIRCGRLRFPIQNRLRPLYRARYSQDPLREAIDKILGANADRPFSKVCAPLLVSTVEVRSGAPRLLRSAGLAGGQASDLCLRDGLLASAAAPTYFPPHRVGGRAFVDGGLVANAPDLAAVAEAVRHLPCGLHEVRVLSIGTAGLPHATRLTDRSPGLVKWLVRHGLVQLTLSAQERLAVEHSSVLLGDRYLRIDHAPTPSDHALLGLDKVTRASTEALYRAAEDTIANSFKSNLPELRRFLTHCSRPRTGLVG